MDMNPGEPKTIGFLKGLHRSIKWLGDKPIPAPTPNGEVIGWVEVNGIFESFAIANIERLVSASRACCAASQADNSEQLAGALLDLEKVLDAL